jgi:cardiolipin synthase
VQLLLQGRYEYFLQYHAARPVYGTLLAAGVEIHEYAPSFLHAKVAVIDALDARPWATVGSSNLDPLSLLLAREANVVVSDGAFCAELRQELELAIASRSVEVKAATHARRSALRRMGSWAAYMVLRVGVIIAGVTGRY